MSHTLVECLDDQVAPVVVGGGRAVARRRLPQAASTEPAASPRVRIQILVDGQTTPYREVFDPLGQWEGDPAGTGLEPAGDGRSWFDPAYWPWLEAVGLTNFEAVMRTDAGTCLRVLRERENWRLTLRDAAGRPLVAYLKRHRRRTWASRCRALWGEETVRSAGRAEANGTARLAAAGVGSMRVVAWGERLQADGQQQSFLLTEALAGYLPLDDFIKTRFPRAADRSAEHNAQLDRLLRKVAAVARRFHAAGYNHQDFYGCHFFVREQADGYDVRLIDLQRMQHRRLWRRRWIVKDLAQLAWSLPRAWIGCRQRLAFLHHYLGTRRLRPSDKRLIRSVAARQRRMERRLGSVA